MPDINRTFASLWYPETNLLTVLKSLSWVNHRCGPEPGIHPTPPNPGQEESDVLSIDVCVLLPRGEDIGPNLANYYREWLPRFRQETALFTALENPSSSFTHRNCLGPNSHVLVSKTPGHITILDLAPPAKNESEIITQLIQMPCIPTIHSPEERLMTNLLFQYTCASPAYDLTYMDGKVRNDLLFNGKVHVHPSGAGCKSRLFLRSARLGEPRSARIELTKLNSNSTGNWIEHPTTYENGVKLLEAFEAAAPYPVCEKCHRRADNTCSLCKGAWYCGVEHQNADWKTHKDICDKIASGNLEE